MESRPLRSLWVVALLQFLASAAPPAPQPPPQEVEVIGQRLPIIVNGRSIQCRRLANDPQDSWVPTKSDTSPARQSVLIPRESGGGFDLVDDSDQVGGEGVWRRVGRHINEYVFRAPQDGKLLCIGSKGDYPSGYAQLRQVWDAAPLRGKRLRFTAWAASRRANRINFWLASADPNARWYGHKPYECSPLVHNVGERLRGCIYDGGNSNGHDWYGSHGWTPVLMEIGPVSKQAKVISFGFVLGGSGDVWLYDPKL